MFSLTDVLIDALWILGLAGALATFSYLDWHRKSHGRSWRAVWSMPRLLLPLSLSAALFCAGLALNGVTAYRPDPWWQTAIWTALALLFMAQAGLYGSAGRRQGWDVSVDEHVAVEREQNADHR